MEQEQTKVRGSGLSLFPCEQCGAQLEFQPGTTSLLCPYCGHISAIAAAPEQVQELDLKAHFDLGRLDLELESEKVVHCNSCSAEFTVPPTEVTKSCPFCGANVVVTAEPEHRIRPNGVLPFGFKELRGREYLGKWLGSRFWAPNDLKQMALKEGKLKGMYVPFWTYDCDTTTSYTGQRGDYYYETESYTDGNGNSRTRQVRRTAWSFAAGTVFVHFDDVLVLGSDAIPQQYGQRLLNWDLNNLLGYEQKFLVGFQTLRYSRDIQQCWFTAQEFMQPSIDGEIRRDIGGDEQRISSKDTEYENPTFKHLLLPVFAGSYRYRGKSFRVLVNGRTGEVQGEAPISFWKVALAVLLGLIVLGTIFYFWNESEKSKTSSGPYNSAPY